MNSTLPNITFYRYPIMTLQRRLIHKDINSDKQGNNDADPKRKDLVRSDDSTVIVIYNVLTDQAF